MKANKFFIVAAAVFTVLFAVVLWADEITNRVDFVSKQLGCEFPYMVAENSETGGFYAEAKLKNPQRLKAQGFPDAESDYVVSIQESLPGEYWVKVVPEHRMLDAAEEKLIVVEYKTTSQSPASQSPADQSPASQSPADQSTASQRSADQNPTNRSPADAIASGITIKGVITNFEDVKSYFSPSSYVQLVEISPNIESREVVVNGFLNLDSDLPKMSVSSDGSFALKTNYIKPGSYWLYLQNFKPAVSTKSTIDAILAKGETHFQIFISENVNSLIFDCGNLSVLQP